MEPSGAWHSGPVAVGTIEQVAGHVPIAHGASRVHAAFAGPPLVSGLRPAA
jgi:hypothetical protein